jgi:hypothetical protein
MLNQFGEVYKFMGGYRSIAEIFQSMTIPSIPGSYVNPPLVNALTGSWEYDLYIGSIGLGFLLFFGIFRWLAHREGQQRYFALAIPILVLVVVSLSSVFQWVQASPIPIFKGERVSTRIIIIPFLFLVLLAVIQLQRWLNHTRRTVFSQVAQMGVFAVGGFQLWQHFQPWQVVNAAASFRFPPFVVSAWHVANHLDPAYDQTLSISLTASALALWVILLLVWNEKFHLFHISAFARRQPGEPTGSSQTNSPTSGSRLRYRRREKYEPRQLEFILVEHTGEDETGKPKTRLRQWRSKGKTPREP